MQAGMGDDYFIDLAHSGAIAEDTLDILSGEQPQCMVCGTAHLADILLEAGMDEAYWVSLIEAGVVDEDVLDILRDPHCEHFHSLSQAHGAAERDITSVAGDASKEYSGLVFDVHWILSGDPSRP